MDISVRDAALRPVRLGSTAATARAGADGSTILSLDQPLDSYPANLTDRLVKWANEKPEQVFLSMRYEDGSLVELTYAETLKQVEAIGTALLERNLPLDRPLVILSENDIENALLVLAALHVGIPYAPVSPAYSLLSTDFLKLRGVFQLLDPPLIFASDGERYGRAIRAVAPAGAEIITVRNHLQAPASTPFETLLGNTDRAAIERAHAAIRPDTLAKILFTSGTTGAPKGVVYPHLMIASQRQQVAQTFAFTMDEPAVMVDWLPWHHTFGGTQNFGTALYSGGSLRIDIGRPTPELVGPTVQNLREVSPTIYLNTPQGFASLLPHFRRDPALRESFFRRLKFIYYGGAVLHEHIWDELDRLALETVGARIMIASGLGCTEAGPVPASANWDPQRKAVVGLPVPGIEIKVAPVQGKLEFRLKGACVTPGYWKNPDLTKAAFDEDGFYKTGDAVQFLDPDHPEKGLRFDGRIAENFKIANGTWVHVGDLRVKIVDALAPLIVDAVITAPNRDYLGAILFPNADACRNLAGLGDDASVEAVLSAPAVVDKLQSGLDALARSASGAANTVQRMIVTAEPATLDTGELTDKRSISQRAVLERRVDLVESLYLEAAGAGVLVARI
ncbi:feruloyl-CoA synthase [Rhizobium sp. C4]|uniref:feruloyl-CoA synthase n=1 Tax=Rhizobium sp. C4 TaxID=1349800 RepID=UPI001E4207EC|nr:feruloyl-CoA synthase [Rhizobium sp. C4]MCD2172223.1 feruloyl-CoA synthase [Rhizobium sp. C4]